MNYDFAKFEKEAQKIWEDRRVFDSKIDEQKEKSYVLEMFPYPSGDGLHVGHVKVYTASDIIANYKRLRGYNVLHPMGWDAFGLPAENYAIKMKKNPAEVVAQNIKKFKSQCESIGFSYDWSREINTTDPDYYKWTQWIFLKLFEKGLAYQAELPINFCPSCKTGLANEEVVAGECERCHTKVERKILKQWTLKITDYADRLLNDLDDLDWPEPIKQMQRNWIGKSEGAKIKFEILNQKNYIEVFTTRADTLFGVTYVVLAPEHPLVENLKSKIHNLKEVVEYVKKSKDKSDLERAELIKEKSGVELKGVEVVNPIDGEKIPVFVADYVLGHYGTGAIMAVPGHDQRDFEFAKKYGIAIKWVIGPNHDRDKAFEDYGILENSDEFDGLDSKEAASKITQKLKQSGLGDFSISYKLRDWVFSRQRYWGEPIPVVHCEKCGVVAVDEKDLPIELPEVENYEPSGDGSSPLAKVDSWVNTTCPKCGGPAKRETDTMPNWAGSCWYYLRFADPKNSKALISKEAEKYYLPVDFYIGGAEHAVLHLLYARFWHKFLYDLKITSDAEPFQKFRTVGLILAEDRQKMSKSRGNVVNPDDIIERFGSDAMRMYVMFIGPFDQPAVWSKNGVTGTFRFLEKIVASFSISKKEDPVIEENLNKLIVSITNKIEKIQFNTAVSDFMKFANENNISEMTEAQWKKFLVILSPFAPHLCEKLFSGFSDESIFESSWPEVLKISETKIEYPIQINGKRRASIEVSRDLGDNEVIKLAKNNEKIKGELANREIKKTVFVKEKIINFVI